MITSRKFVIAATIAIFACVSGYSQIAPGAAHPAAKIDLSKLPEPLQVKITTLQAQAIVLKDLARHLGDQMKGLTAEEKQKLIQQFRDDHAAMFDAQRTLAKEIRAQMKLLREQRKGTG